MEKLSWDVGLRFDPEVFTGVFLDKEYLQGLMLDAARYCWLREQHNSRNSDWFVFAAASQSIDDSIDTAMKETA